MFAARGATPIDTFCGFMSIRILSPMLDYFYNQILMHGKHAEKWEKHVADDGDDADDADGKSFAAAKMGYVCAYFIYAWSETRRTST